MRMPVLAWVDAFDELMDWITGVTFDWLDS